MSIISSIFGKKRSPCESMIVELIDTGHMAHFMERIARDKGGAKFESALISGLFFLKFAKLRSDYEYKKIEKYTFGYLFELSKKFRIQERLEMNLTDFMDLRFEQYTNELERMLESQGKSLPVKTLFNLYDTPLKPNSGVFFDPFVHMAFLREFLRFMEITEKATPHIAEVAKLEDFR